jgi:lipid-A-disaccharide synthase
MVLLLPGSRPAEVRRHGPILFESARQIAAAFPDAKFRMVLPNAALAERARRLNARANVEIQAGGVAEALAQATIAISKTGTVTLECAYYGVPTVAIYKASWSTAWIGRRIIKVKYLAMPNLLADAPIFPELLQQDATPDKIAAASLELLSNEQRRAEVKAKLQNVVSQLGGPGATQRAAAAILKLMGPVWNPDIRGSLSQP